MLSVPYLPSENNRLSPHICHVFHYFMESGSVQGNKAQGPSPGVRPEPPVTPFLHCWCSWNPADSREVSANQSMNTPTSTKIMGGTRREHPKGHCPPNCHALLVSSCQQGLFEGWQWLARIESLQPIKPRAESFRRMMFSPPPSSPSQGQLQRSPLSISD